jgi:hypothetical protein
MRQNANAEVFKGTVSELAGKIMGPNGEPLNVQDVQFLTRIGNGTFAKRVGTAPGTGTRGGKRAIIWEITPTARLTLGKAEDETASKSARNAKSEASANTKGKSVEELVAEALAKHGITPPKAKRQRRSAKAAVEAAVKVGRKPKAK